MTRSPSKLTPMVLSLALVALTGTTEGAITCEAVTTRYESTVTCFFGTDMFDSKHNFNLQFYYPNLQADPETHLMCNWLTAEDMNCKASRGMKYNHVLADQMTVKGPPDLRRIGGQYVCQVLPSLGVPVKPCTLTFSDVTTTTTTTQSNTLGDLRDKVTTSVILSALVLTVALIILIAVLFIVCSRVKLGERISEWRKWKKKEPDVETEGVIMAEETTDAEEKEILLHDPAMPLSSLQLEKEKWESGKDDGLIRIRLNGMPGWARIEAGSPEHSPAEGTQPAGEEGVKTPQSSWIEDVQVEVAQPEEASPLPIKKKWWQFWKRSSSSSPKDQPKDRNSTGTGDPLLVTSGKRKEKSGKTKDAKGGGGKETSPGDEQTRRPASPADGKEEPRRQHRE